MSKKLSSLIILISLLVTMLAACGTTPEPAPTEQPSPTQAVPTALQPESAAPADSSVGEALQSAASPPGTGEDVTAPAEPTAEIAASEELSFIFVQHALCEWDSFWCPVEAGVQQAAQDTDVQITLLGPDQFDLDQVAGLIDQAVAAQPDGLAVTIADLDRLREPIQRAIDAGIPVVAYNSGAGPQADGLDYLTFLGSDESQAGYLSAIRLADAGGTKGVCINHQPGHKGLDARCEGFVSAMDTYGLPAEVLAISGNSAESQAAIAEYYAANPDTDAFLTLGPTGAQPFYAFMAAAGLGPGSVFHGTFDTSDEIEARIKDGTTLYAVGQQPFYQGYGAVQTLVLYSRYGIAPVLDVTPTGPSFIDAQSLDFVADPDRPATLAVVQHALCTWDPFWCPVESGIRQAAEDMSVNVTIQGPDRFDLDQMVQLADQAVAAQPDGFALTIPDADRLRDSIQRALDGGTSVVAYNAGAGPLVDNVEYLTYLGMDRFYQNQGGYQSGLALAQAGATRAVCLNHQVGQTSMDARCEGFANAMSERGIPVETLALNEDPAQSQAIISDYYSAHPDTNAFLSLGPVSAAAFYAFEDTAGLGSEAIKHGTFDLTHESAARIKDGTTLFVIDQQPFWQGYGAVQALMLQIRYGINPVLPVLPTGPVVIQTGNVEAAEALLGQ